MPQSPGTSSTIPPSFDMLLADLLKEVTKDCDDQEKVLKLAYEEVLAHLRNIDKQVREERRQEKERKAQLERERREAEEKRRREAETKRKQEIIDFLQSKGIHYLYHFTAEENLKGIREHGGLYSWKELEKKGWQCPSPGGGKTSRGLDLQYNLEDRVRLSFCSDHPMAFRVHNEYNTELVLLRIKLDVAAEDGVIFTDMNATKTGFTMGQGIEFLKKHVNFEAVNTHYLRRDDHLFDYHQAEIMVEKFVPSNMIVNLDNPEYMNFG